jgi:hypothetical protein
MVNVMVMNFLISGRGGNRKTRQDHQSNYNSSALYTPNKSENDNVKSLRSSKVYPFGCPSVVCSTSEVNLAPTSVTELESGHYPTVTKEETVIEEIV